MRKINLSPRQIDLAFKLRKDGATERDIATKLGRNPKTLTNRLNALKGIHPNYHPIAAPKTTNDWSDEKIEAIKKSAKEGLSASQIAKKHDIIGKDGKHSRNAVVGLLSRMNVHLSSKSGGRSDSSTKGTPTRSSKFNRIGRTTVSSDFDRPDTSKIHFLKSLRNIVEAVFDRDDSGPIGKIKLHDDVIKKIYDLRRHGKNKNEVAEAIGHSPTVIHHNAESNKDRLKDFYHPPAFEQKKRVPSDVETAVMDARAKGKSRKDIAAAHQISQSAVQNIFRRLRK